MSREKWFVILVMCFLGVLFFFIIRIFNERDPSAAPSRARLEKEISLVVPVLGGEPKYVDRQIRKSMISRVLLDKAALSYARRKIESDGWRYISTVRRGNSIEHKYCRDRLAFIFEITGEKGLVYGVVWESQPRAFAYCKP